LKGLRFQTSNLGLVTADRVCARTEFVPVLERLSRLLAQ
jgi:hypothetical protein